MPLRVSGFRVIVKAAIYEAAVRELKGFARVVQGFSRGVVGR